MSFVCVEHLLATQLPGCMSKRDKSMSQRFHGRQQGGGEFPPPLEFENDDVICCSHAKYPKFFARALGARIKHT